MKKIFTLFTVSMLSLAAFAQPQSHNPDFQKEKKEQKQDKEHAEKAAQVQANAQLTTTVPVQDALALKETEHDFGKIPQGKPVTTVFEVTNTGTTPFKLDNVQASCGCTTPQWDKEKVIAPNEKSEITVGYNAAAEGFFTKTVTITYNGSQTKQVIIKGEVWKTPASSAPANTGLNDLKN